MEEANRPDIPDAYVTHSSDGRLRLKVKKGDKAYFARIRHAISTVKGVGKVTVNPGTGSILVLHDVKPNDISKFAFTHKLFEIRELSLIQATTRERIKSILNRADVRPVRNRRARWTLEVSPFSALSARASFRSSGGE